MKRILVLISVLFAVAACDTPKEKSKTDPTQQPTPEESSEPAGTDTESAEPTAEATSPEGSWTLVTMNGKAPLEGTALTLDLKDGNIRGNAGCNSFGGTFAVEGSTLKYTDLGITEMACPGQGILEQESAYFSAISKATNFAVTQDGTLTLSGDGVSLEYSATVLEPITGVPLEGTAWKGNTFFNGETASSLVANTEISLNLTEGVASGNTTCNSFTGSYTLSGDNQIAINVQSVTERACGDPAAQQQEADYIALLKDVKTYTLEGRSLTLTTADGKGVVYSP